MLSILKTLKFYGWRIVAAGAIIQGLHSGLLFSAFGSYSVLLQREFGWTATTLSVAFAMTRAESGLLGPIQGWILDRLGPRFVMLLGTTILGISFLLFATMNGLSQFFIYYFLMSLGASLSGFFSITISLVNWFQRYRSRALAFAGMGGALGGLSIPIVVFFLEQFGWRTTAFGSGIIILLVGIPLCNIIRHRPIDSGHFADGINPDHLPKNDTYKPPEGLTAVDFTAKQAFKTRAFWTISLGHGSALLVVGAIMLHLPLHLTSQEIGMSLQEASFIVGTIPAMQIVGHLLGGYLGDKINKRLIAICCMIGHTLGLLLLTFAIHPSMIWIFAISHGIAWGARGPLMQSWRADYFGTKHFGTIMGFSSLIIMIGMVIGPLIAGISADITGSYKTGFIILTLAAGFGTIFFSLSTPPKQPLRANLKQE